MEPAEAKELEKKNKALKFYTGGVDYKQQRGPRLPTSIQLKQTNQTTPPTRCSYSSKKVLINIRKRGPKRTAREPQTTYAPKGVVQKKKRRAGSGALTPHGRSTSGGTTYQTTAEQRKTPAAQPSGKRIKLSHNRLGNSHTRHLAFRAGGWGQADESHNGAPR